MTKLLLALLLLDLVVPGTASAQLEFPASWAGIWELTSTERQCGSSTVLDMYTENDTLCVGQSFDAGDEADFQCTGTIGESGIDVSCSSEISEGPCTITFTYSAVGTRSGDSFSGTDAFSITYSDGCGPVPDQCVETEVSGTRVAPAPLSCGTTPVHHSKWGLVKHIYR